jgi:hypothetical protein
MTIEQIKNQPTILITGASKGVGAACARVFAKYYKDGVNLVLVARQLAPLELLKNELKHITRCKVLLIQADVAQLEQCEILIKRAVDVYDEITVLVNNAGLHHRGNLQSNLAQNLADMVDVNLRAPVFLSSLALPHMTNQQGGAIVMVGSLAGLTPLQGAATYSATKAGLRAFTYALHDELKDQNIKVAIVSPGPIDTGFIMDEIDEVEDIVYSQPMSSAEQVANNILALVNNNKVEIAMPRKSGWLATLAYLFPKLSRAMRDKLYEKGRKNKEKYKKGER